MVALKAPRDLRDMVLLWGGLWAPQQGKGDSVSPGRTVGTTKEEGYSVSLGRPLGATAEEGYGVSPGRTVDPMKEVGYGVS